METSQTETPPRPAAQGPVELVIQTRIVEGGSTRYASWQARIGQLLESQAGFQSQQVHVPSPPAQVDWIVIQRFGTLEQARGWLGSETFANALEEIQDLFVGKDDIFLRRDAAARAREVSALIARPISSLHPGAQEAAVDRAIPAS